MPTGTGYFMLFAIHEIPAAVGLNDIVTLRANNIFHNFDFVWGRLYF